VTVTSRRRANVLCSAARDLVSEMTDRVVSGTLNFTYLLLTRRDLSLLVPCAASQ